MNLVLLPGLHGTSELFDRLIAELAVAPKVINLPAQVGATVEDYSITIEKQLPLDASNLVAESFSGCLVPSILNITSKPIKGVIFVASFIETPNRLLVNLAKCIPNFFLNWPFMLAVILKRLFLNGTDDNELLAQCVEVIGSMPSHIIKERLTIMAGLKKPTRKSDIEAVYIQAKHDRVIGLSSLNAIRETFSTTLVSVDGPHFILQAQPKICAEIIEKSVTRFVGT